MFTLFTGRHLLDLLHHTNEVVTVFEAAESVEMTAPGGYSLVRATSMILKAAGGKEVGSMSQLS